MRVVVDYDLCEANGLCMETLPEVFRVEEDEETLTVLEERPDASLRPRLEQAVGRCPRGALAIVDE